jgi:transcriptional regulator with XRE-family HTH domain
LSQPEFAELLGVSQSSVSDWERGQYIPAKRAVHIVKLLQALGNNRAGLTPTEAHLFTTLTPELLQHPYHSYVPDEEPTNGNYVHG